MVEVKDKGSKVYFADTDGKLKGGVLTEVTITCSIDVDAGDGGVYHFSQPVDKVFLVPDDAKQVVVDAKTARIVTLQAEVIKLQEELIAIAEPIEGEPIGEIIP